MAKSINDSFKEYWLDVAGTTDAKNFNDAMRAGLEAAGYSGGLGKINDLKILTDNSGINGFAAASAFHNNLLTIHEIKKFLIDYKINVKN